MNQALLYKSYEQHQLIDGPSGQLEVVTATPENYNARFVICHADPTQGGTMHHKVITTLTRNAYDLGLQSIRFNYRGVQSSEGTFGHTHGEAEDLNCILNWAADKHHECPLWLAGFSFGATISAMIAATIKPQGLISIAPVVNKYDFNTFATTIDCPWWMIQGMADQISNPQETEAWVQKHPQAHLIKLEKAGHFFHGQLDQLQHKLNQATQNLGTP
jgi:uncharacterized protein